MKLLLSIICVACLFNAALVSQEKYYGSISGIVIDGTTQQPLPGANVVAVELQSIGSVTDENGAFLINKVPVGEYSLRATLISYKPTIFTNVVVSTGRSTKIKFRLNEEAVNVDEVVVHADYFSSEGSIGPISAIGLNGAEVKRSPGSAQDMQRIVQNLPGVANGNDQTNELIVRGGAPDENLTVMDYIEIPSTNHYPNQFNSGGPINMINVDLIEDLRFSTGAFTANYGDKLSSVMDISLREGDKQRNIAGQAGFSMAGIGTLLEGGYANGKGTWIFSARQSLLQFADKIVGISSIGLTAIPKYFDIQFKATYELSPTQKLILNGIYGDDIILMEGEPDAENEQKINKKDSSSAETIDFGSKQYALGLSLKSLWGTSGYSVLSLYTISNTFKAIVSDEFAYHEYDDKGKVKTFSLLSTYPVYKNDSEERMLFMKYDAVWILDKKNEVNFGARIGTNIQFKNNIFFNSDTLRYDFDRNGTWDTITTFYNARVNFALNKYEQYKIGLYLSDNVRFTSTLSVIVGGRFDYFTYSKKGNISPRITMSYEIQPMTTKLNLAYGEFYQTLPFPTYGDMLMTDKNRYLENSHARHIVLGIEHVLDEGLKGSIEAYYKEYDHIPIDETFIYSANKAFRSDKMLSVGKRTAKGIDIFLQQKQVTNYYGTISFTYSKTMDQDLRKNLSGFSLVNVGSYPSLYDYPYLSTFVAGKVVKDFRSYLDDMPFYIKYPTMIFPFSNDMEASIRFRYASGAPYTPKIFDPSIQKRIGNVTWSGGTWSNSGEINSTRFDDYQRLDIQWLSRWHLTNCNIVVFLEIENLLNHKNIAGYTYNSDGTKDIVYQYAFFPVGGVTIEF